MNLYKHKVNFFFLDFGSDFKYYNIANKTIDWLNQCFEKNTNRYFYLGSVKKTDEVPTGGAAYDLPATKFSIDIYVTNGSYQGFGHSFFKENGDGVITIYLDKREIKDVTRLFLNVILHEMGHVFGAAIGEYYKSKVLVDLTGVPPQLRVSAIKKDDYWHHPKRSDWLKDVMLVGDCDDPTWSPLTALAIRHGLWRFCGPPVPDLTEIPISTPFEVCHIASYKMGDQSPVWEGITDYIGEAVMDWGGEDRDNASCNDQFRKIVINGYAFGLSIFDVQQTWLSAAEKFGYINHPSYTRYSIFI